MRRPRLTIVVKLLASTVIPTLALFAAFAFVAHEMARGDLEAELGRRLEGIAAVAADRLRGDYLVDLVEGDEESTRYQGARRRLEEVAEATGAARIYVFDEEFKARVDTSGSPIGTQLFQAELDRTEVARVFDQGALVSSVLFEGTDGRLYKAAYAPVQASDDDPTVLLVLGADAPADFFERLAALRGRMFVYGLALVVVVAAITTLIATRITRPVRALAEAAERIGTGDLSQAIERKSRDEVGFLAATMERMRSDLRARDERMQLMLAGIAHEVRNPLGGIELFTGILRDEIGEDEEKRGHIERIERELAYLKKVVENFLEYARRPAPEMVPVDLRELVADVLSLVERAAEEAGVRVESEGEGSVKGCRGDAGQLRRALLNLVRNAIQAAGHADEGRVVLHVAADGDWIELCVENTGEPISDEVREHLFEPFYTTREKGTGLGLAFVAEIARDHGGRIDVHSDSDATRFVLRLPRG